MSFYDDTSRYKKRRIITRRGGGGSRRRDDDDNNNDRNNNNNVINRGESKIKNSSIVNTGYIKKPTIVEKKIEKILEKPVWMSDEDFKKQQDSLIHAIKPKYNDNVFDDNHNNENSNNKNDAYQEPMASEDVNIKLKYLKNLQGQGKDEIVREFYNTQTFNSRQNKRTESPIYRLRSFNNCIKYILINKYGKPNGSVLELGCGKGGDLAKWGMIGTNQYVGIDLSDESIREAIKRYKHGKYNFQAVFATGDAFKTEIPEILQNFNLEEVSNLQFDNVSMQFCMHYAFSNEESVESMLTNVSKSLKVGGMFIGTIPSSDYIKWRIKKLKQGEKGWGNSIYSVTFPDLECYDKEKNSFTKPFGNVYNYFLKDAVENVPEYIVPFEKFRSMCEDYGLELRYKRNFFEMFNKEVGNYFNQLPGPLIQSLRLPNGKYGVSGDEKEACSFYMAFAFERV